MLRALMDSQQHAITDGQCKKKEEILRKKQKEMLESETLSEKWKKKKDFNGPLRREVAEERMSKLDDISIGKTGKQIGGKTEKRTEYSRTVGLPTKDRTYM